MSKILIKAPQSDVHAECVKWGLERLDHEATIWSPALFPEEQSLSVSRGNADQPKYLIQSKQGDINLSEYDAIWHRRMGVKSNLSHLHEADRSFALNQCNAHMIGFLWSCADKNVFEVNKPDKARDINYKILQLKIAQNVGFNIPKTLFSNDPDTIRAFAKTIDGELIFKPFSPTIWRNGEDNLVNYATKLTAEDMEEIDSIKCTPAIFQQYIPKQYEVRAVFMGHTNISIKLDSQMAEENKTDWRVNQCNLPLSRTYLPKQVEQACLSFMKQAGIVFGSFDFIVREDGSYVFLEINEQGQFLGYENPDAPLLQPFLEFLLSRDPEFKWQEKPSELTFANYMSSDDYAAWKNAEDDLKERHLMEGIALEG